MQKRRGFTLIELLVVVAIIAVLVAMLLPALAKSRDQARRLTCLSRLRSLGLVIQYYANENNEFAWLTSDFSSWQPSSMSVIYAKYLAGGWPSYFWCPVVATRSDHSPDGLDYGGSCMLEDWSVTTGARHPIRFNKYSATVIVSDRYWSWMQALPRHAHVTGLNLLWGDLSGKWFEDRNDYLLSLNMAGDGGFWVVCNLFDWLTKTAH